MWSTPRPRPAAIRRTIATASVPGIALAQLGAILDAEGLGYDLTSAGRVEVLGHSQGVLAEHMMREIERAGSVKDAGKVVDQILAIAELIGVAGTRQSRALGLHPHDGEATPMLSVRGATAKQLQVLVDRVDRPRGPLSIAVTNAADHHVLSGYPEDLAAFAVEAEKEHRHQAALRERKVRGGSVFTPVLEYLEVTVPFHSPLMSQAVEQAVSWAGSCGFDMQRARQLAEEVLVNHVDWAARVHRLLERHDPTTLWIVDMGPGTTIGKMLGGLVQAPASASSKRPASRIVPRSRPLRPSPHAPSAGPTSPRRWSAPPPATRSSRASASSRARRRSCLRA
ncbi:ACP S-malonyltransferase [Bifidobacterium mongoliense DSM 21395]|uniref:ACP S-malonyltransferase n=1 Tax=Bifidobacterium mongoliense DSM 21395 TaxID=1437603 RepID=A0A087BNY5_9BIFI|nr:ACP S-malonyltransferase [Bifidobacterium mongoliense DSM 21395]